MTKWKVTLWNQHAMCGIHAVARTRHAAFHTAFHKAGPEFRAAGYAELGTPLAKGNDVMWLAAFNNMLANMRRGSLHGYFRDHQNRGVEIQRIEVI